MGLSGAKRGVWHDCGGGERLGDVAADGFAYEGGLARPGWA
jgi:hypothetical protein